MQVLQLAALKGVFTGAVEEQVTFVNAPALAAERGLEVQLVTEADSPDHRSLVTLRGARADGSPVSVSGTVTGPRQVERLTEIDGFDLELVPRQHLVLLRYADRPGVVGTVGATLGEADVNIAGAQVARATQGGPALMALTIDSAAPPELLERIAAAIGADTVCAVDLTA